METIAAHHILDSIPSIHVNAANKKCWITIKS